MTGDFSGEPFFSINALSMKVKSYGETINLILAWIMEAIFSGERMEQCYDRDISIQWKAILWNTHVIIFEVWKAV